MTQPLSTNGLLPSDDFPAKPYEDVHQIVSTRMAGDELYEHFAGAWNAVAYRFHGAIRAGEAFQRSLLDHGPTPTPAERYAQDQALAEFFGSGYSTFESVFYGVHTLGGYVAPTQLSLSTPKARQQVSPAQTSAAFRRVFPENRINGVFDRLFADPAYQEWKEIRNVLTHRTAPGRRMYVGIGMDDAPPTEWKLNNVPIDDQLVPSRRAGLVRALDELLIGVSVFARSELQQP